MNKVGLYELYFDLSTFDGLYVNLFDPNGEDDIPQSNLDSMSVIEILTITDTHVTGRMDATLNQENTVNGNFTVVFCPTN